MVNISNNQKYGIPAVNGQFEEKQGEKITKQPQVLYQPYLTQSFIAKHQRVSDNNLFPKNQAL